MLTPPTREIDSAIVAVEDVPGVVRYVLPPRDLGRWRRVVVAAGWIAGGIAGWLLWRPLIEVCEAPLRAGEINTLLVRLVIAWFVAGLPLKWIFELLHGHVEVEASPVQLRASRKLGWRSRTRSWDIGHLKHLQIAEIEPRLTGPVTTSPRPESLCVLLGVLDSNKGFVIAMAYPRSLLESLSARIASHFPPARQFTAARRDELAPSAVDQPPRIAETLSFRGLMGKLTDELGPNKEPEDLFVQPAGSRIRYEILDDGVTMEVPPSGVWKGSAGLFQGGLILVAVTSGFTLLFALTGTGIGSFFMSFVALSPFWLGSVGLLLAGWNMGHRHAAVAVVGDKVSLLQISPFKTRRLAWMRSEITSIRIGDSGMEINDQAVRELQFLGPKGKLFGLMAGHDPQEIIWAATLLRFALLQRPWPSEMEPSPHSNSELNTPTPASASHDSMDFGSDPVAEEPAPAASLPGEVAGFYADSLGSLALIVGGMTIFFSWVPVLGLMMTIPVGGLGLLLSIVAYMMGTARGVDLRWKSLKAAGLCLLGIAISAFTTWLALHLGR